MCQTLAAEEPYLQLIEAMRKRGFSDTALEYIGELRARPNLPQEIKAVLSYEEFKVHQQSARRANTGELKQAALDKALAALERFTKESPTHPLAATANSEQAGLFLDQAKARIWESRSETNVREKQTQQEEARQLIAKARTIYQTALEQFKTVYDGFIGNIPDEKSEPERYKLWRDTEISYLQAQFDLAVCTYQEARTYDQDSPEHTAGLKKAAEEFESIHSSYRQQGVGLYARVMQGKCFEEQGELGRAMGIYNEILGHPGQSEVLMMLKGQTFYFKLIVLNEPEKHDYKLVVSEATKWLTENRRQSKTTTGLGIQWERARALEILGSQGDISQEEKDQYLQQAYNEAREISLYAGEFRDLATAMVQRLEPLVSGKGGDPEDFGVAYSVARNQVRQHKVYSNTVKAAKDPAEKQAAQADFDLHLKETERIIRLGLSLVQGDEKPTQIAAMRYFLAFTLYYAGKPYDAASVANFIVVTATEEQSAQAQDASQVGLAALSQIMYSKPVSERAAEREMMAQAAGDLLKRWPGSSKADDARFILADVYRSSDQPMKSVEYYDQVTENHLRYPEALLRSGQMHWVGYLSELQKPEEDRVEKARLEEWMANAEQRIKAGMAAVEPDLASDSDPPDIYVVAKITLVEILNSQGKEAESLKLLTEDPHSIMASVRVDNEANRPSRGPQSRPVAIQTYQLLLRTYMGLGDIDNAIKTMGELESVAGTDNPDALTQIYIQLGFKLKEEIDRLRAEGNQQRLDTVTSAFDRFLGALADRQSGLDYNSLLWIAESYANLGDSMKGDSSASAAYYEKAAKAYDRIISESAKNPEFINPAFLPSINTRIAVLLKRQGQYEQAYDKISEVLKANPKQLDAQMEAALMLKEWAAVDNLPDKYLDAVMGNKREENKESPVYGFAQLAILIQQVMENPDANVPDIKQRFEDVLFEMADALHKYALTIQEDAKRNDMLLRAKGTINQFALHSDGSEPEKTWEKFDELYATVQRDLRETPVRLERPVGMAVADGNLEPEITDENPAQITDPTKFKEITPTKDTGREPVNWLMAGIGILGGIGFAAGLFFLFLKPRKKPRRKIPGRDDAAPVSIGFPAGDDEAPAAAQAPAIKPQARPKPKAKPAAQPAAEVTATSVAEQPVKKKKSIADLTPEEKAALKKKLLAQKQAAAAQAKKSEES